MVGDRHLRAELGVAHNRDIDVLLLKRIGSEPLAR
jgi:hypothetical protein